MTQAASQAVIIGGGIMGGDIATVFAAGGWTVHVVSPTQKTRDALAPRLCAGLKKLDADEAYVAHVKTYARLQDIDWPHVDFVVEAVPEDLALKQRLFAEVETLARPEIPLVSNTSNFPIAAIGKDLKTRSRVFGLHFFMPAHLVPLVEVVSAETSDPHLAERIVQLMKDLGKAAVWVKKDVPGFVGNRLQHAMMREALYLIADGIVSPEGIDTAVRYGFGFRFIACGPIMQKEMSGWDTNFFVGNALYPHLYNATKPPAMLREMIEAHKLGMKTKEGFWKWTDEAIAREKAGIEKALQAGLAILKDRGTE